MPGQVEQSLKEERAAQLMLLQQKFRFGQTKRG